MRGAMVKLQQETNLNKAVTGSLEVEISQILTTVKKQGKQILELENNALKLDTDTVKLQPYLQEIKDI